MMLAAPILLLLSSGAAFVSTRARPQQRVVRSSASATDEYPWSFEGRMWFRPSLVRAPDAEAMPAGLRPLSLFGWTLGGLVCLEYDVSPVGPYLEVVHMGAVVAKRGVLGQWGRRLRVSTHEAEAVCVDTWGVPAEEADIVFDAAGASLALAEDDGRGEKHRVRITGWDATRSSAAGAEPIGSVPVLWTPQIKALWSPLRLNLPALSGVQSLALHPLRLSASSLRLQWSWQPSAADGELQIPVGLSADGLKIEIGREMEEPL